MQGLGGGGPAVERQCSRVSWKLPDNTEEKPKSLLTATLVDLDFFDSYFNRSEKQKAQAPLDQSLEAEHMALLPSPLTAPWLLRDELVAREGAGALLQHSHHKHSIGARSSRGTAHPPQAHDKGTCGFPASCSDSAARTLQSTTDRAGGGSEGISKAPCCGFCWALPEVLQRGRQGKESRSPGSSP